MDLQNSFRIINEVAEENEFIVEKYSDECYRIHLGLHHGVDFLVESNSTGYIQCKQWDENTDEFNRAVYSLRYTSDVIYFCTILMNSASIRARRVE